MLPAHITESLLSLEPPFPSLSCHALPHSVAPFPREVPLTPSSVLDNQKGRIPFECLDFNAQKWCHPWHTTPPGVRMQMLANNYKRERLYIGVVIYRCTCLHGVTHAASPPRVRMQSDEVCCLLSAGWQSVVVRQPCPCPRPPSCGLYSASCTAPTDPLPPPASWGLRFNKRSL